MMQPSNTRFPEESYARAWFVDRFGEAEAEEGELEDSNLPLTPPSKENDK